MLSALPRSRAHSIFAASEVISAVPAGIFAFFSGVEPMSTEPDQIHSEASRRTGAPPPPAPVFRDPVFDDVVEDPLRGWLDRLAKTWHAAAHNSAEVRVVSRRLQEITDDLEAHRQEVSSARNDMLRVSAEVRRALEAAVARADEAAISAQESTSKSAREAIAAARETARVAVQDLVDEGRMALEGALARGRAEASSAAGEVADLAAVRLLEELEDYKRQILALCEQVVLDSSDRAQREASKAAREEAAEAAADAARGATELAREQVSRAAGAATEEISTVAAEARKEVDELLAEARRVIFEAGREEALDVARDVAAQTVSTGLSELDERAAVLELGLQDQMERATAAATQAAGDAAERSVAAARAAEVRLAEAAVDRLSQEEATVTATTAATAAERAAAEAARGADSMAAQAKAADAARAAADAARAAASAAQASAARIGNESRLQVEAIHSIRDVIEATDERARRALGEAGGLLAHITDVTDALEARHRATLAEVVELLGAAREAAAAAQGAARGAQASSVAAERDARRAERAGGIQSQFPAGRDDAIDLTDEASEGEGPEWDFLPEQRVEGDLFLDDEADWRNRLRRTLHLGNGQEDS